MMDGILYDFKEDGNRRYLMGWEVSKIKIDYDREEEGAWLKAKGERISRKFRIGEEAVRNVIELV